MFRLPDLFPALDRLDLLAPSVTAALQSWPPAEGVRVAEIDPDVADTEAFCARYDVPLDRSANCVVVSGRRAGVTRLAACLVLAVDRADINRVVRRRLDARKVSFASTEVATESSAMEYGGITPIGLPSEWPILVDSAVAQADWVVVGSGLRRSKLLLAGHDLTELPAAVVVDLALSR